MFSKSKKNTRMIPFWDIITSVSCYFAGELFKLFSLWPAKKLQAEKNHAKLYFKVII